MKFDVAEWFLVRKEMDFRAALVARAHDGKGSNRCTLAEFHLVDFAIAPDAELKPFRKGIYHGNADAVQATRYLVGVGVEFSSGMQLCHDDFGGRAFEFVIFFDAGWNASAIVDDGNRVVGMY